MCASSALRLAAIGVDNFCAEAIGRVARTTRYFRFLPKQLSFSLLRMCALPAWRFLCCTTPDLASRSSGFDNLIRRVFNEIIGTDAVTDHFAESVCGAGLLRYAHMSDTLFSQSRMLATGGTVEDATSPSEARELHLRSAHQDLRDPEAVSACGNHSTLWMKWSPHKSTRLTDQEFVTALRLRCRVPLVPLPVVCFCGTHLDGSHNASTHILRCSSVTGVTWSDRHAGVCGAISRSLGAAACQFAAEPTCYRYDDGSAKRPDFTAHLADGTFALDVTIVSPDSAPGKGAKDAAAAKTEKHGAAAESLGHEFLPLAFETFGHCDRSFDKFSRMVAGTAPSWCSTDIADELRRSVSCAIARGNARILAHAAATLRRHASISFAGPLA